MQDSPIAPKDADTPRASRQGQILSSRAGQLLIERVRDYGIFMLDTEGRILTWNEGAERIKGYRADEIIGQSIRTFYTPEARAAGLVDELLERAKKEGRVEDEGWRLRKDGTKFWADVVITALYDDDGTLLGFGKVTRDLTERKAAEDALAELSGRLLKFQDEERRRIAAELHDTTSPLLTSLSAKLYSIKQRSNNRDPDLDQAVAESLTLVQTTQDMVRNVASVLHPPVLEHGGLLASLRWFVESYPKRTGLKIDSKLPDLMPRLPVDQETTLFRLVREWFDNMSKGGMTAASIRLIMTADKIQVRLEALEFDGKVSNTPTDMRTVPGALSIIMAANRERLRQIGGRLDLEAQGATVTATLPVRGSTRA